MRSPVLMCRQNQLLRHYAFGNFLEQPAVAEFITAGLWHHFVSPNPDPRELQSIARHFRESGYDIKVALRGILTSDAFYAPRNRAALFKSPVDFRSLYATALEHWWGVDPVAPLKGGFRLLDLIKV